MPFDNGSSDLAGHSKRGLPAPVHQRARTQLYDTASALFLLRLLYKGSRRRARFAELERSARDDPALVRPRYRTTWVGKRDRRSCRSSSRRRRSPVGASQAGRRSDNARCRKRLSVLSPAFLRDRSPPFRARLRSEARTRSRTNCRGAVSRRMGVAPHPHQRRYARGRAKERLLMSSSS